MALKRTQSFHILRLLSCDLKLYLFEGSVSSKSLLLSRDRFLVLLLLVDDVLEQIPFVLDEILLLFNEASLF